MSTSDHVPEGGKISSHGFRDCEIVDATALAFAFFAIWWLPAADQLVDETLPAQGESVLTWLGSLVGHRAAQAAVVFLAALALGVYAVIRRSNVVEVFPDGIVCKRVMNAAFYPWPCVQITADQVLLRQYQSGQPQGLHKERVLSLRDRDRADELRTAVESAKNVDAIE
jgi:hypothetical protein